MSIQPNRMPLPDPRSFVAVHEGVPGDPGKWGSEVGAATCTFSELECICGEICSNDQVGVPGSDDPNRGAVAEKGGGTVLRTLPSRAEPPGIGE